MFKHHLDRYKYPDRHASDPAVDRDHGLGFLRMLDARLTLAGHLCGPQRGLADAAIVPFVRQFAAVDRRWFDAQSLPCLKPWLVAYLASDLFEGIMQRATPWNPDDPPVIVTAPAPAKRQTKAANSSSS